MSQAPRALTRSEAVEILLGLVLMLGALAWWHLPAAIFATGAALVGGSLYFRRLA